MVIIVIILITITIIYKQEKRICEAKATLTTLGYEPGIICDNEFQEEYRDF
jgi:hypothetical protein